MRVYDIFLSGGPVMWPLLACSVLVVGYRGPGAGSILAAVGTTP